VSASQSGRLTAGEVVVAECWAPINVGAIRIRRQFSNLIPETSVRANQQEILTGKRKPRI